MTSGKPLEIHAAYCRRRGAILAAAAAAAHAVILSMPLRASVTFNSGSSDVIFKHDPDRESSLISPKIVEVTSIPSSSSMPSWHINKTFMSGDSSTQAVGSFGHVTNATTASFILKPGTGVTQVDPGNSAYPGSSTLRLNIDNVWDVDSDGFGPIATGYISLSVGGVVGTSGSAKFIADLQFTDPTTGAVLRPDWVVNQSFTDPGSFSRTFLTSQVVTGGELNGSQRFRIKGYLEFRASNAETPSSIAPLDVEIGGAPPTGTWGATQGGSWNDPRNWIRPDADADPLAIPEVPSQPGHRARILARGREGQVIAIDKPITLGTLDLDGSAIRFEGKDSIRFETLKGSPAVLNIRNTLGAGSHLLATPIQLIQPLELHADALANVSIPGRISGERGITKFGDGSVRLANANTYAGGTTINGGTLHADVASALGTGEVIVSNGALGYNATGAARVPVKVLDGGIVELGVLPQSADRFDVRAGGVIGGDSRQLSALALGNNLLLESGAMIAHTDFDPSPEGNPKGLEDNPDFIFGLTRNEFERSFIMGSNAVSPWRGMGAVGPDVQFGVPGGNRSLGLLGDAEILVPTTGKLTINAFIGNFGEGPASLHKTGAGTAVIAAAENGLFDSFVHAGTLQVDGVHPGGVNVDKDATLRGIGTIGGHVKVADGGRLAPGNSVGVLTVADLDLFPESQLDFELGDPKASDRVAVQGNLVLDGQLNVHELPDFGPGTYPLFSYGKELIDKGLVIGEASDVYAYEITFFEGRTGGSVRLNVLGEKQWNTDGGGDWGTGTNWLGPIPNVAGDRAQFLGAHTGDKPAQIEVNGRRIVGHMRFDNTHGYALVHGEMGGTIHFDNLGRGAVLEVNSGKQAIGVRIAAIDDLDVEVTDGASLTASDGIIVNNNKLLRKLGPGLLDVTDGIGLAPGASLQVNQGTLRTDVIEGGRLSIREDALVQIRSGGRTSKVFQITFAGQTGDWNGRLDLRDNDLVVQATPAARLTASAQVAELVAHARNNSPDGAAWNGYGITSSLAQRDENVGLAVMLNDAGGGTPFYTNFGGQPVDANSILVKFTWNGDADLSGSVDLDDYFAIDSNFLGRPKNPTYSQGDFNYDGQINLDDYFLIDSAFLAQNGTLGSAAGAASAVAVPEPACLCFGTIAAAFGMLRRRR